MALTKISWCDYTFNPWWGCTKVSDGCKRCYAEALDQRYHAKDPHWGPDGTRRFFGDAHWLEPIKWNTLAQRKETRRKVFCASMADVFEDRAELEPWRDRLWTLIRETPWLDWLLLTKRPQNFERMVPEPLLPNVWLGTSCENQEMAEERLPLLLAAPAAVHFASLEPLLADIDLRHLAADRDANGYPLGHWSALEQQRDSNRYQAEHKLDWVIVGCESGHGARTAETAWLRSLRDQCAETGRAFFLKQADPREGDYTITDLRPVPPIQGRILGDMIPVIGIGPGSREKGRLVEIPYLDGVQHAQWPKNTAGEWTI